MSKILEEFNIKAHKASLSSDYDLFEDKDLLDEYRKKILEDLSDKGLNKSNVDAELINLEIDEIVTDRDLSNSERISLFNLIENEVNSNGPLNELLQDDNVTEIMVNSPSDVYIEIDGNIEKDESISFVNDEHIIRTINRLIEPVGKTIDVNNPMVDARLEDGSRINAVIPPLSKNPIITIRKFKKNIVTMDDLVANGTLTAKMATFLEVAVKAKLNILVVGPSGSGKTTLLNILGNYIDDNERIITIEDVMELNLRQKHVVSLETRNANYDGVKEVSIRDLVRNSLRMRPDRIIIGEVRGSEAFDLLQAMNSGHDGSLTTLHANSSRDALSRLETMILMDGLKIPMGALREYIGNAIDLIVYITRMKDGKRKIVDISEVIDNNDSENALKNIFSFRSTHINENGSVSGEFILQPYKPEVLAKIKILGINDLDYIFNPGNSQNNNQSNNKKKKKNKKNRN